MWVCTSIAPGITYLPVASMVSSAVIPAPARSAPMSAIVSPSTRTSATDDTSVVTIVPLLISVRMRTLLERCGSGGRCAAHGRDDLPSVELDLLFLVAVHQVQVELVNARPLELAEFHEVLLMRTQDAEAVDDLVGHELGVRAADLGMVEVVVPLALPDVGRELLGQVL